MDFAEGHIYHVYNRGNNSQTTFFTRDNYLFLDKLRKYLLPYADVLAWCLMSNHFHLMISINRVEVSFSEQVTPSPDY